MTNLVERCKELVEWADTGLLNGGTGGAMRELAAQLQSTGISPYDAMSVAEHKTHKEAMTALPELVAALEAARAHLYSYTGGFAANEKENALFIQIDAAISKVKG